MKLLDRVIHEPGRLFVLALLYNVRDADFIYLLRQTGLTKGNLSTHLTRLEEAGYIESNKGFRGRIPFTHYRMTSEGRSAFRKYRQGISEILAIPDGKD